ncbi:hypothetical protein Tsubulata_030375, partial [Turnera subulata]
MGKKKKLSKKWGKHSRVSLRTSQGMAADHPKRIKRLASLLSQCLDQLKNETTSSSTTTTTSSTTTTTTTISLNDLPDDVLLRILGYLPSTKQAIQASLISRRWRNLWFRLPCLLFPATGTDKGTGYLHQEQPAEQMFIHRTLVLRPHESPQLQRFYVQYYYSHCLPYLQGLCDLESWVYYAINHGVQELELDCYGPRYFDFPAGLSNANSSVRYLKITIRNTCPLYSHQPIKSLTSLRLERLHFDDDCHVSDMLSLCQNLESLSLENFRLGYTVSVIKIHFLKLKKLNLGMYNGNNKSLEIDCPNLTSLVMNHFEVRGIELNDVSSLEEARIYFPSSHYEQWLMVIKSVSHVRHLTTQSWCFKFLARKDLSNLSLFESPPCHLKHLEIRTDYSKFEVLAMASFLQLLPYLEMLILEPPCRPKNLYKVNFEPFWSNLSIFSYPT